MLALAVVVIGIPIAAGVAWMDQRHLTWGEVAVIVAVPPLLSMLCAGASVIPSRTRPHSTEGDVLGIAVGSVSFWTLVVGVGLVAVAATT